MENKAYQVTEIIGGVRKVVAIFPEGFKPKVPKNWLRNVNP